MPAECVGGVLIWRRHWLMFVVGNGYRLLVLLAALRGGGCGSVLVVRLVMVPDILLGPEGTSTAAVRCVGVVFFWSSLTPVTKLSFRRGSGWCVVAVGVVGWPLFENCTVDASIFVVKLSRANGECLGTRSR